MLDGAVKQSKYPLHYHITPLQGLLNDPNGLVQFKGTYHVFYQWNPTSTMHENKSWGHVVSQNMVDWERKESALVPSEYYDKDGVYSGSAIVKDDELILFYTGNVVGSDDTKSSYQCYAVSTDGIHFEKKGPLFPHPEGYTRNVRDPKVWYEADEDMWYLIVGAQTEELKGTALLYASKDLEEWESRGELLTPDEEAYMWECPDLFELNGQWLFLFSPQGLKPKGHQFQNIYHSVYIPLTKEGGRYASATDEYREMDWGFEFYAPQTFLADDGRRILYGWMGVMKPEVEQKVPTIQEGWIHGLTIPRELRFEKGQLFQLPVEELKALRQEDQVYSLKKNWQYQAEHGACEVDLQLSKEDSFELTIKNTTTLSYDVKKRMLTLSRENWVDGKQEQRQMYLNEPLNDLQIFIDGSSVEIFTNQGSAVATARYFEAGPFTLTYQGSCEGNATVYSLERGNG